MSLILFLVVLGITFYYIQNRDSIIIKQDIYLSKDAQGDFLMLEISNPSGEFIESIFTVPEDIVENVVVEGGSWSIVYKNNSVQVKATTKDDFRANIQTKIYLKKTKTRIPITIISKLPEGYRALPKVNCNECITTQKDNIVNVNFDLKEEKVEIEIEVLK